MSIELVKVSNHLIFCCSLLLPSIFPSIRVFSNELAVPIRWPKYWPREREQQAACEKKKKKPRGERGSGAGKLIQRVLVRKLYFILGIRPLEVKLGQ